MIRDSGDTGGVTIRSQWQDLGGAHSVIVLPNPPTETHTAWARRVTG